MFSQRIWLQFFGAVLLLVPTAATTRADVTIYLSDAGLGDGAPPANLDLTLGPEAIGTSGAFNIWVQTDAVIAALDLDLVVTGTSIALTNGDVQNYFTPLRWNAVTDGVVFNGPPNEILGMEGFAILGIGANGINPSSPDEGYDPVSNAFHFATVTYDVVAPGQSELWLSLGANESSIAPPTCLRFGVGDQCLDEIIIGLGVTPGDSLVVDGLITVTPEPASLLMTLFAVFGLLRRPRRGGQ
jgi:hypothetical protein